MDRDGSGDQYDVVKWLGLTAGLHEDVVTEATPRLRSRLGEKGSPSGRVLAAQA